MKTYPHVPGIGSAGIVRHDDAPTSESEWLARQPYLALDPAKQPVFTVHQIEMAAVGWQCWEERRRR